MGYFPTAVLSPTVNVIVEVPAPGAPIVLGLKLTLVPVGAPVADRLIELLNPPPISVVIVEVPCLPCMMLTEVGDAVMVKVGPKRKATICMIHCAEDLSGAVAL